MSIGVDNNGTHGPKPTCWDWLAGGVDLILNSTIYGIALRMWGVEGKKVVIHVCDNPKEQKEIAMVHHQVLIPTHKEW